MPDDTDFLWGLDLTARRGLHSIFCLLRELKFHDPGLGFKPFKPYPFLFAIKCLHSHEAIEYAIMDGRQAVESSFLQWEMGLFDEPKTDDGSGGILWVGELSELCGIERRCALLVVQELAREIEGILRRITRHEVLREMRDAAKKCCPGGHDGTWRGVYWEDQERWNFFPHEEPRLIAWAKSECRQLQQWEEKLRDEVKEHTSYWESERQLGLSADGLMRQLEKERNDALRVWSGRISRQTSLAAEPGGTQVLDSAAAEVCIDPVIAGGREIKPVGGRTAKKALKAILDNPGLSAIDVLRHLSQKPKPGIERFRVVLASLTRLGLATSKPVGKGYKITDAGERWLEQKPRAL